MAINRLALEISLGVNLSTVRHLPFSTVDTFRCSSSMGDVVLESCDALVVCVGVVADLRHDSITLMP